ncbi:MAG: Translation initiation factor IF-2 [Parcubacteria group bacterium GW2011_GWB1_40_14]|nr:MAG: Translation initiation factor IF-2 [Parcubacteria group bacterium GW2011_GWB1_40_14]
MVKQNKEKKNSVTRPPIVVVLGHVDHGKTTLLDTIRKTNIAAKESGGITQHIGAYQVEHNGKLITFIDTPGHEAFGQMRSRGANVADIAIVVVAADEGVKPQTKEALDIVKNANLPYIIALNKIDKPNADADKVKRELAENGVMLEGWGGDVSSLPISAKSGEGLSGLMDLILLIAEVGELQSDPSAPASGVVIEAHKDQRRGSLATLLVRQGTLRSSANLVIGGQWGRARSLENFMLKPIEEAGPSTPVLILGLSEVSDVGETFITVASEKEAEEIIAKEKEKRRFAVKIGGESPEVMKKIIIKADVVGSLEAIVETLKKISSQIVGLDIIVAETGNITENDVKLASNSGAAIIAFRTKAPSSIELMAQKLGVTIVSSDIIYELVDGIRAEMEAAVPPEIIRTDLGVIKILATFKQEGAKQVIGGEVTKGTIKPATLIDVERGGHPMGKGKLNSVQMNKVSVDEVPQGKQCGLQIELKGMSILPGDVLKCFMEERHKRPLL